MGKFFTQHPVREENPHGTHTNTRVSDVAKPHPIMAIAALQHAGSTQGTALSVSVSACSVRSFRVELVSILGFLPISPKLMEEKKKDWILWSYDDTPYVSRRIVCVCGFFFPKSNRALVVAGRCRTNWAEMVEIRFSRQKEATQTRYSVGLCVLFSPLSTPQRLLFFPARCVSKIYQHSDFHLFTRGVVLRLSALGLPPATTRTSTMGTRMLSSSNHLFGGGRI